MDREKQKLQWLSKKILFYTEGEACTFKKFPYEITRDEFRHGVHELRPHLAVSEVLEVNVGSLAIFVRDIPCYKIVFEDGYVFCADYLRSPGSNMKNMRVGSLSEVLDDTNESYLDFLIRTVK